MSKTRLISRVHASWWIDTLKGFERVSLGNDQEAYCATSWQEGTPPAFTLLTSSWLIVTVGSDLAVRSCGNANAARAIPH